MTTQKGQLQFGVEYPAGSGQLHYDFELRLPMVGDNIAALETVGPTSGLRLRTAMLAMSLVALGDIPKEAITHELLEESLVDDDYDVLSDASEALKKKRMRPKESSGTTESPSSSSADTESQQQSSGS